MAAGTASNGKAMEKAHGRRRSPPPLGGRRPSAPERIDVDQVMASIGIGRFHYELLFACGLGFAATAVEIVTTAFLLPELQRHWDLSNHEVALVPTIVGCGSFIGAPIWGTVADRYGRRLAFMVTVLFVFFFGVISAFAMNLWSFITLRVFVGFGYGGAIAVDFAIFSEMLPTDGRGDMLFLMQLFWPVGQCTGCLIAWGVIPAYGWRVFIVCSTVPSLLAVCLRPWMPESPRWLLLRGRDEDAKEVLAQMAERCGKTREEVGLTPDVQVCLRNEDNSLLAPSDLDKQENRRGVSSWWVPIMELFSDSLWRTTVGTLILGLGLEVISYGLFTIMPTLLERKGIEKGGRFQTMLLTSLAEFPGVIVVMMISRRIGRLLPLKTCLIWVCLAFAFFIHAKDWTSLAICCAIGSFFQEGGWALFHTYVPEVYPTELRATAVGAISGLSSVMSMAVPVATAHFLDSGGLPTAVGFFVTVSLIASLITGITLNVETNDRDLQDSISSRLSLGKEVTKYGAELDEGNGASSSSAFPQ